MNIQQNLHCLGNLKQIKLLHDAGIDHAVIAHFFQSENIPLQTHHIKSILESIDVLNKQQISGTKLTALMNAKADLAESEQILVLFESSLNKLFTLIMPRWLLKPPFNVH